MIHRKSVAGTSGENLVLGRSVDWQIAGTRRNGRVEPDRGGLVGIEMADTRSSWNLWIRGQSKGQEIPIWIGCPWRKRKNIATLQTCGEHRVDQFCVILIDHHAVAGELRQSISETNTPRRGIDHLRCTNISKALSARGLLGTHSSTNEIRNTNAFNHQHYRPT